MQSLLYVKGSDGAANASLMTVTNVRSIGATSIITNTVSNVPTYFYGSMGTPHTFTDPVTGETITTISDASAVDFAGQVVSGHVEIISVAPGYSDHGSAVGDIIVVRPITEWANNLFNILNQSHNNDGTIKNGSITTDAQFATAVSPVTRNSESSLDYVASGLVWTGDSYGSTRNASMTAGVVYINGKRLTVTAVTAHAFTASKDTYIDILDAGNGTGTVVYTETTNNNVSPALAANSIRIGIIVTGASNIANAASVNQGQIGATLPIASSVKFEVTDSLGNLICPRDPRHATLGYKSIGGTTTTSLTDVAMTGALLTVNVPTALAGRKAKISTGHMTLSDTSATVYVSVAMYSGSSVAGGTVLGRAYAVIPNAGGLEPMKLEQDVNLVPGTMTFIMAMQVQAGTGNASQYGGEHFKLELV